MFKLVDLILEVGHTFIENDNEIYFINNSGKLYQKKFLNSHVIPINEDDMVSFVGKYLEDVYYNVDWNSYFVERENMKSLKRSYKMDFVQDCKAIVSTNQQDIRTQYFLDNNRLYWSFDKNIGSKKYFSNNLFINSEFLNDSLINAYSLLDGNQIWQYDVSELCNWNDYDNTVRRVQLSRILGEYGGELYIYLNCGKILVLDIQTGKNERLIENEENTVLTSLPPFSFFSVVELNRERGKLIQLAVNIYSEYDLNTHKVQSWEIDQMGYETLQCSRHFVFDTQYIYFIDDRNNKIGVFDLEEKKIKWQYNLSQEGIDQKSERPRSPIEIKYQGDKLFVRDSKNTLLVLERIEEYG